MLADAMRGQDPSRSARWRERRRQYTWENTVLVRTRAPSGNASVAAMQGFVVRLTPMTGQGPRQAAAAARRPRGRSSLRRGPPPGHDSFPVVGLGASAGGLDAFRRLLAELPAG